MCFTYIYAVGLSCLVDLLLSRESFSGRVAYIRKISHSKWVRAINGGHVTRTRNIINDEADDEHVNKLKTVANPTKKIKNTFSIKRVHSGVYYIVVLFVYFESIAEAHADYYYYYSYYPTNGFPIIETK